MKIRRRNSKKRYLGKKDVYDYERLYVDLPTMFRDARAKNRLEWKSK